VTFSTLTLESIDIGAFTELVRDATAKAADVKLEQVFVDNVRAGSVVVDVTVNFEEPTEAFIGESVVPFVAKLNMDTAGVFGSVAESLGVLVQDISLSKVQRSVPDAESKCPTTKTWQDAQALIYSEKFHDAAMILAEVADCDLIAGDQPDADVYNLLGFAYRKMSPPHFEKSEAYYRVSLTQDPTHLESLAYLGELYLDTQRFDDAREVHATLTQTCIDKNKPTELECQPLFFLSERFEAMGKATKLSPPPPPSSPPSPPPSPSPTPSPSPSPAPTAFEDQKEEDESSDAFKSATTSATIFIALCVVAAHVGAHFYF